MIYLTNFRIFGCIVQPENLVSVTGSNAKSNLVVVRCDRYKVPIRLSGIYSSSSSRIVRCGVMGHSATEEESSCGYSQSIDQDLLQHMVRDALIWCSLHGMIICDKQNQRSGIVPGVGMVHAPFSLLPMQFPEHHWRQACDVAPIFNELVDRVSLDAEFLQSSLSRTKDADVFTRRLLDIHAKIVKTKKKEVIRLGLHRSDYMLDDRTKRLLQIELNTISSSFPGLSTLVCQLHRTLLNNYGKYVGLDAENIIENTAVNHYAEALARAWAEYNSPRALLMFVVRTDEHNMYDQHLLDHILKEKYNIPTRRKTLTEIDATGELLPDGTLLVGGEEVAIVYFRDGYSPTDYPSESEWNARLLMEQSSAIKCPSISYHLTGTKKIQKELARPGVLERFLEKKDDILKIRECFAGLWSLDDAAAITAAIEKPDLFVMKPQREGGGNNIYGDKLGETLQRFQRQKSGEEDAYILMERIFPNINSAFLVRNGSCHKHNIISELGIYGAYLRNKDKVIINKESGYLLRTKISTSDEGGIAAGFSVLDSIYST